MPYRKEKHSCILEAGCSSEFNSPKSSMAQPVSRTFRFPQSARASALSPRQHRSGGTRGCGDLQLQLAATEGAVRSVLGSFAPSGVGSNVGQPWPTQLGGTASPSVHLVALGDLAASVHSMDFQVSYGPKGCMNDPKSAS